MKRLDGYELKHTQLLGQIVDLVSSKFMPIITRHALSGRAHVNSEDPIFDEPLAIPMLIDIFSERGYHAVVDKTIKEVPARIDLQTGEITAARRPCIAFRSTSRRRRSAAASNLRFVRMVCGSVMFRFVICELLTVRAPFKVIVIVRVRRARSPAPRSATPGLQ